MNPEGGLILFLGLMLGVPLLLGLLMLLNRLAGRTLIPLWLPVLLLLAGPLAGSLWLDVAGSVRAVKVTELREHIDYGQRFYRTGMWTRQFSVQVEHEWSEASLTPYLSLGADAATFDALRVGQQVNVRVLEIGKLFKFGRLANRSTYSILTNLWPREPRGPWREGTATVQQISEFTEQRLGKSSTASPLRWPYRIVRLSFTPPGRAQAIEVMDNIETASLPGLVEKAVVPVSWPEDDPRAARISGARPGRPWANWFYDLAEWLVIIAVVLALILFLTFFSHRRKRRRNGLPA
jgi:hypothetical protein